MYSLKVFEYKLNADLNKKVFNLDLKIAKEGLSRITKGKLFHSLGAACWKDRSPLVFSLALG